MNEAERFLKSKDFALVLWSVCRGDAVSYCRSHRTVPPFIYTQVLSGLLQFNATGREFYFLFVFLFVLVLSGRRRRHLSGNVFPMLYTLAHPACFYFRRLPFSSHLHLLRLLFFFSLLFRVCLCPNAGHHVFIFHLLSFFLFYSMC